MEKEVLKNIEENAKSDWMKLVNKHKKRQKGLPALSTLNTNAGNVEHNINMFNMMNSTAGDVTVDGVNGNVSTMCEMMEEFPDKDTVTIHYDKLALPDFPIPGSYNPRGVFDPVSGIYQPSEPDTKTLVIPWDYETDVDSVIEYLQDREDVCEMFNCDNVTYEEFRQSLIDNLDDLMEKFDKELQAKFLEFAQEDAYEHCDYEDYVYDPSDYDDGFNMSLRTLL